MADEAHSDDSAPPAYTRFPSGEREWSDFIQRVAASGDVAERHFIELKSDIDPTGKEGAAKVAKFILGAANRDPERAANYLEGHAVMILGVGEGNIRGLARFEAKDLVGAVQQYVGEPGPRWDFQRIRVDDDRDAIAVVVAPPQAGDPIWPCCREGVGLIDGRIYIRADGETREAKSGEIRALQARASAAAGPRPDLTVALRGGVHRFNLDGGVLDDFVAEQRQRLEVAAPAPGAATPAPGPRLKSAPDYFSAASLRNIFTEPDPRSRDEYLAEIDEWEERVRKAFPRLASHFALVVVPGAHIEACSQSYLEDVQIKVQLKGPVRAREKPHDADFDDLPSPPAIWGPKTTLPLATINPADYAGYLAPYGSTPPPRPYSRYDSIDIDNSNSVDLTVLVEELRPQETYVSSDELVLWVPADHDSPITGTWTATAKGHHERYSGDLQIEVHELTDLTEVLREYLQEEPDEDDEDDEE